MLELYQEEVEKRIRSRRVFWLATIVATGFLYLFFQGYYPYVRFDLASYFENGSFNSQMERPQIVRAFGIINIRSLPVPDSITINGQSFGNGEKGIYDFGDYDITLEKSGYIGLSSHISLDKKNPFHIEALELVKNPVYQAFPLDLSSVKTLPSNKTLLSIRENTSESGATSSVKKPGKLYAIMSENLTESTFFRTNATPIGAEYFSSGGVIMSLDESSGKLKSITGKSGTGTISCKAPQLVDNDVFCNDTKVFVTGDHVGMKTKILSVGEKIMQTADGLITSYTGKNFRITNASGAIQNIEDIVRVNDADYLLSNGELIANNGGTEKEIFDISPLQSVGKAFTFDKETFLFGYSGSDILFTLIDERENKYLGRLENVKISDLSVQTLASGYLILTRDDVFFYQKGANTIARLLHGEILGYTNNTVLFRKNNKTFVMPIVYGQN